MIRSRSLVLRSNPIKEPLQKWLRRPIAALHGVLRCSFITHKLRASNTLRLALGHARSLLQRFLNYQYAAGAQ